MPHRSLLPLCLACLACAGCGSTKPPPATGFSAYAADRVALVFADAGATRSGLWNMRPDAATSTPGDRALAALLVDYGPHFDVPITDATGQLSLRSPLDSRLLEGLRENVLQIRQANRSLRKGQAGGAPDTPSQARLPLGAADLAAVRDAVGARYALAVSTAALDASAGEIAVDVLTTFAVGLIGRELLGTASGRIVAVETVLLDMERGEIVWYGLHGAEVNPARPEHISALVRTAVVELFTGRTIPPYSFLVPLEQQVVVYLHGGGRVVGYARGIDGLEVVVDTRDGERVVPIESVRSIRSFTGAGKLFPIEG